ncbi:Uncharacterised protein r2_g2766 [Pycnogonum litorale]
MLILKQFLGIVIFIKVKCELTYCLHRFIVIVVAMETTLITVSLFLLTVLQIDGKSRCFVCLWSGNMSPCGDQGFKLKKEDDAYYDTDCTACYKITKYDKKGEKTSIRRGCSKEYPHFALKCQSIYNTDDSYTSTCACLGEYCNVGYNVNKSTNHSIFLLPSLIIIYLFYK